MEKRTEIHLALKEALKNKDQIALSTIRLIVSALKDRDIAARGTGNTEGIPEADILALLQSMIKQRLESSKIYKDAGRPELAQQEDSEILVIQRFLPKQLEEAEVISAIAQALEETGAKDIKDMGKVMGVLKTRYAGQIDMGKVGGLIKTKLAQG